MSSTGHPNTPESRYRARSRLRRLTSGALVAATGATVVIGVVISHDHPGKAAASTGSGSSGSGATGSTVGGTSSSSGNSGSSSGNSGNTGNTGNTGSSSSTPSSTTLTPTVTSGGTSA
jgi:hypothetical protein